MAKDTLRRLADSSKRVKLLEEEDQGLKSLLSKIFKARDSAVANSDSRRMEIKALEARVHLLGDELKSLKRRETTIVIGGENSQSCRRKRQCYRYGDRVSS